MYMFFFTKMEANSDKMFGKINFKLFYKMYFLFLFFLHLDVLFSIPGEGKIFFLVFDKEGVDGKMFVKMGYPGLGWGDTLRPPRLPPSATSTRPDKMEKS